MIRFPRITQADESQMPLIVYQLALQLMIVNRIDPQKVDDAFQSIDEYRESAYRWDGSELEGGPKRST